MKKIELENKHDAYCVPGSAYVNWDCTTTVTLFIMPVEELRAVYRSVLKHLNRMQKLPLRSYEEWLFKPHNDGRLFAIRFDDKPDNYFFEVIGAERIALEIESADSICQF